MKVRHLMRPQSVIIAKMVFNTEMYDVWYVTKSKCLCIATREKPQIYARVTISSGLTEKDD